MTKFFKDKPDDFGLLCIEKECATLHFSRGGSHQFENCAGDVNSVIDLNWRSIMRGTARGVWWKNDHFSNESYDQCKYPDSLIYTPI